MEKTLADLGGLLLKAIPTFLIVLLLHFYLKYMFFKPLQRVLDARYQATEGARKMAEQSLENAAARTAEYESALRAARAEVYKSQEESHRRFEDQRTQQVAEARGGADAAIQEARRQLAGEVEAAKRSLAGETDALAAQIADTVLNGRVA